MHILVVEDDERVARLIERALVETGYRVDIAGDGITGLAQAERGDYDIVILDVLLPRLDGVAVCRRLRGRCVHPC